MTELLHFESADPGVDPFRELAPVVYEEDPVWAPQSEGAIDECLAWAEAGEIEIRATVAMDGDRPVARAMAILPGVEQGWVGLFECLPDATQAGVLVLEECVAWLRGRGVSEAMGPRTDELRVGLLIDGFDRPHTVFTAHNPAYYAEVFEAAGFGIRRRMFSFEFSRDRVPTFRDLPIGKVTVRSPDPARVHDDLARIEAFQDSVFRSGPGRVRRSAGRSRSLARRLLPMLDLDLVVMAEDKAGETIGVVICLPDVWQPPPVDRARLVSVGVAPGWRGKRVSMAMASETVGRLLAKGYRTLEGSWVMEDNTRTQVLAKALGGRPGRVFALYGRTL